MSKALFEQLRRELSDSDFEQLFSDNQVTVLAAAEQLSPIAHQLLLRCVLLSHVTSADFTKWSKTHGEEALLELVDCGFLQSNGPRLCFGVEDNENNARSSSSSQNNANNIAFLKRQLAEPVVGQNVLPKKGSRDFCQFLHRYAHGRVVQVDDVNKVVMIDWTLRNPESAYLNPTLWPEDADFMEELNKFVSMNQGTSYVKRSAHRVVSIQNHNVFNENNGRALISQAVENSSFVLVGPIKVSPAVSSAMQNLIKSGSAKLQPVFFTSNKIVQNYKPVTVLQSSAQPIRPQQFSEILSVSLARLNDHAVEKWNKDVLKFLLGENSATSGNAVGENLSNISRYAKRRKIFVDRTPELEAINQQVLEEDLKLTEEDSAAKTAHPGYISGVHFTKPTKGLTPEGFAFVFQERGAQLWAIVLKLLKRHGSTNKSELEVGILTGSADVDGLNKSNSTQFNVISDLAPILQLYSLVLQLSTAKVGEPLVFEADTNKVLSNFGSYQLGLVPTPTKNLTSFQTKFLDFLVDLGLLFKGVPENGSQSSVVAMNYASSGTIDMEALKSTYQSRFFKFHCQTATQKGKPPQISEKSFTVYYPTSSWLALFSAEASLAVTRGDYTSEVILQKTDQFLKNKMLDDSSNAFTGSDDEDEDNGNDQQQYILKITFKDSHQKKCINEVDQIEHDKSSLDKNRKKKRRVGQRPEPTDPDVVEHFLYKFDETGALGRYFRIDFERGLYQVKNGTEKEWEGGANTSSLRNRSKNSNSCNPRKFQVLQIKKNPWYIATEKEDIEDARRLGKFEDIEICIKFERDTTTVPGLAGVIVESNFKLRALTTDPEQIELLSVFAKIERELGNWVVGELNQDSVNNAFSKGFSANQIIAWLESASHWSRIAEVRAHEQAGRDDKHLVPSNIKIQLRIWEKDRNRVSATPAVLLDWYSVDITSDQERMKFESVRDGLPEDAILQERPWPESVGEAQEMQSEGIYPLLLVVKSAWESYKREKSLNFS